VANTVKEKTKKVESKIAAAAIPATEIELDSKLYKWKAFLAGPSGSGKTQSATTLPGKILLIDFDGRAETVAGSKDIEILRCHEADPRSPKAWQDAESIRRQIISEVKNKVFPYDSIIWDGLTMLGRYGLNWALTLDPKRGLGGAPAQQHYLPQMDNLAKFVLSTLALPLNILYTGHLEAIEEPETGKITHLPKITGKLRTEIANWFNETYYCYRYFDSEKKKMRYFWMTMGSGQKEFFKSSLNKLGKFWIDPIEINFNKLPVGFADLSERRFKKT